MRILYVSQYFPPEMGAPSARVHELSRAWVRLGHEVTVLTGFANHPTGVKARRDRGVLTRREKVDGIDLVRTYVWATANRGTVKRMVSFASFMASAAVIGRLRLARPDVVVATSPQLLCPVAGYVLARTFGVPFVFEVRDLWPETLLAINMGSRRHVLVQGLKRVADFLYRHCDRIVTVGEGYARGIHSLYGIAREKMTAVPNGIDTNLFVPGPRDNEVRKSLNWGDKFVSLYLGTMGLCHGLGVILETARALRHDPSKLFVFVGEGAEKDQLKRQAQEWQLTNVLFIDQQPKQRVPLYYAACDVGIVTLRGAELFREVLPSKIFEYLGMEKPVILNVDGEARKLVEEAGAGVFVPPDDAAALTGAVTELARDPEGLRRMGASGRRHVLAHFDRKVLAGNYLRVLEDVCHRNGN